MQNNTFVGNLAKAAIVTGGSECAVCKFTLISNEYAGKDKESGESRERPVWIPFTAFKQKGEAIAKYALKGDQLIITYRIENNHYTDKTTGEDVYGYNFIVEDFAFGAPGRMKREQFNQNKSEPIQ